MARRVDEPLEACTGLDESMRRPSTARMYDVFLGGKDNYAVDRKAAREAEEAAPSIVRAARDNRRFMHRTVAWCAGEAGIDQFVDIGTGMPTSPNAWEVARRFAAGAVVVGVDNDPVVLAHDRARLGGMPIVAGDVRDPGAVIAGLGEVIDWGRPVAVLLVAVLHFVTDQQDPAGIVASLVERLAPGSAVVISHVCSSGADPRVVAEVERVYAGTPTPGKFRTHEQIAGLFGGLRMVSPGVVQVQHWPIDAGPVTALPVLGGVGRVAR
ncbi:SAM-dependent methyltransferase [Actinomadura sp. 9N407]|uniref:SAM-dependent methyltransferase n=1 Tax=Actinomadura sp. 9N407 TaxID=3375154 RepID=UPI0037B96EF5